MTSTDPDISNTDQPGKPQPRSARVISKTMLLWSRSLHIYLSMLALLLVLFFATTGFMMNHPDTFGVDKQTTSDIAEKIPAEVMNPKPGGPSSDLAIVEYLRAKLGAKGEADTSGIHDDPMRIVFKGPHYSFDATIQKDGQATITQTSNSLSGWLGNLHKGSDTGGAWKRIIDAASVLLILISLTGLILWLSLAKRRTLGIVCVGVCVVVVAAVFWWWTP